MKKNFTSSKFPYYFIIPVILLLSFQEITAQSISGTVFEDANYGGGAGRSLVASSGTGVINARVELYDNAGNYLQFVLTDATGAYTFGSLAGTTYKVRVVNQSVASNRTDWSNTLFPVQTFRTDASVAGVVTPVTDYVGGEIPSEQDAPANTTNADLAAQNAVAGQEVQSITIADLSTGANLTGVDFGFNFDVIVNTNDIGQGSFRQFILNANALGGETLLVQNGNTWNALDSVNAAIPLPAGRETSIFMISDGNVHAGMRSGLSNLLTGGVAIITPLTTSLIITGTNATKTIIDGGTQTANTGNTNNILLGTGGTVGIGPDAVAGTGDEMKLPKLSGPEVELVTNNLPALTNGLTISSADSVSIRNICIHSSRSIDILVGSSNGCILEQNVIGSTATSFTLPPVRTGSDNIRIDNGSRTGIVRNNLAGFAVGSKILGQFRTISNVNWSFTGNECIGAAGANGTAGIAFNSNGAAASTLFGYLLIKGNLCYGNGPTGISADLDYRINNFTPGFTGQMVKLIEDNTTSNNGSSGIQAIQGDGNDTIRHNLVHSNGAMGIRVSKRDGASINRVKITQNSVYNNGTLGIDLDENGVSANNGTQDPTAVLANNNIDYPVLNMTNIAGNKLTISGFVGSAGGQTIFANAVIEVYKGQSGGNETGEIIVGDGKSEIHAEGERYLGTLIADGDGLFSGTLTVSNINAGDIIVCTATDAMGNTSEFGASLTALISTLPVKLQSFTASKNNNTSILKWMTAQEINSKSFVIERSSNRVTWAPVTTINAMGNSSAPSYYQYTDATPSKENNYYRLKMSDTDGKIAYSEIKLVSFDKDIQILVYPNPATEYVTITTGEPNKNSILRLLNALGQPVIIQSFVSTITVNIKQLGQGIYFVEVNDGINKKVIQISIL